MQFKLRDPSSVKLEKKWMPSYMHVFISRLIYLSWLETQGFWIFNYWPGHLRASTPCSSLPQGAVLRSRCAVRVRGFVPQERDSKTLNLEADVRAAGTAARLLPTQRERELVFWDRNKCSALQERTGRSPGPLSFGTSTPVSRGERAVNVPRGHDLQLPMLIAIQTSSTRVVTALLRMPWPCRNMKIVIVSQQSYYFYLQQFLKKSPVDGGKGNRWTPLCIGLSETEKL